MVPKNILKSLNMTDGGILTLEKVRGRMEFDALSIMSGVDLSEGAMCRLYEVGVPAA